VAGPLGWEGRVGAVGRVVRPGSVREPVEGRVGEVRDVLGVREVSRRLGVDGAVREVEEPERWVDREGVDRCVDREGVDREVERDGVERWVDREGVDRWVDREGVDREVERDGVERWVDREGVDREVLRDDRSRWGAMATAPSRAKPGWGASGRGSWAEMVAPRRRGAESRIVVRMRGFIVCLEDSRWSHRGSDPFLANAVPPGTPFPAPSRRLPGPGTVPTGGHGDPRRGPSGLLGEG